MAHAPPCCFSLHQDPWWLLKLLPANPRRTGYLHEPWARKEYEAGHVSLLCPIFLYSPTTIIEAGQVHQIILEVGEN